MAGGEIYEVPGIVGSSETHVAGLFVIWANARRDEEEILSDLANRFLLTAVYEIRWTPALVRRNFERFYSDLDVRGVYHEINKGSGPFIAATVIDTAADHDMRETSRGPRTVNANFHDAKVDYRARVGHMGLHCSETEGETRRDTVMLLGRDICRSAADQLPERWNGEIERVDTDIAGANGWDTEADLLVALDASVAYVVLGAPSERGDSLFDGEAGAEELQLLTTDYHSLHTVMNAEPRLGYPPLLGGRFTVEVGGERITLGIRTVDDGFIDPKWARACLEDRVLDGRRFPRPPEPDDLATRCYLALTRQRELTEGDLSLVRELGERESGDSGRALEPPQKFGRAEATDVIDDYLSKRGYSWTVPRDPTVPHHLGATDRARRERKVRGAMYLASNGARGVVRTRWLAARDALVFRAPALRRLVRRVMGQS